MLLQRFSCLRAPQASAQNSCGVTPCRVLFHRGAGFQPLTAQCSELVASSLRYNDCNASSRIAASRQVSCPAAAAPAAPAPSRPSRSATLEYIESLNQEWSLPAVIDFVEGDGGLPLALLRHPNTAQGVAVYLHGATIAEWVAPDGRRLLSQDLDAQHSPEGPIRHGITVAFPQYREGKLPEDGFAHSLPWDVYATGYDNPEVTEALIRMQNTEYAEDEDGWTPQLFFDALSGDQLAAAEMERIYQRNKQRQEQKEQEQQQAGTSGSGAEGEAASKQLPPRPTCLGEIVDLERVELRPYIILRLTDNEYTRSLWPHKFELLYKITLQTADPDVDSASASSVEAQAQEEVAGFGGRRTTEYPKQFKGSAPGFDPVADDISEGDITELIAEATEAGDEESVRKLQAFAAAMKDAGSAGKGRGRGRAGGAGANEPDPGLFSFEGIMPSLQLKQEFWLKNLDEPGSPPMEFQLATLARMATLNQTSFPGWVRALGLGGANTFDYTFDPRAPRLDWNGEDFMYFAGQRVDTTFINCSASTIMLCPGDRTHYEFVYRKGFRDAMVYHPGLDGSPDDELTGRVVTFGAGMVATAKQLKPGQEWDAEYAIRFHDRYWITPVFGEEAMPPIPPAPLEEDDENDAMVSDLEAQVAGQDSGGPFTGMLMSGGGGGVASQDE